MSGRGAWWQPVAAAGGAAALELLGRTWRMDDRGLRDIDRTLAAGGRCIFALWHARLLPLVYSHRRRGVSVLVSRSRDGALIAGIVERMGYVTARGSSTRGGEVGMRALLDHAAGGRLLAVTPDGPRGPAGHVKPGLAWLASHLGWPVVPVASASDRAWVMRSWDRFRVPRPFARVVVSYGEPVVVPRELDDAGLEHWRDALEQAIAGVTRAVAARAGEQPA